ncbi:MAG: glycosyltransferase [Caulobacteraceae bacterium]
MEKYTVSLCMIVKNEEKYLEKCLKSVQGKVDEIIVVDTGSTDATIEIAKKYNAVIKHFDWIDDFAAARNFSIRDAKSDYILMLDADEYLDESIELRKELVSGKDYYRVTIKNHLAEGHAIIHKNVRLFRANIGLRYVGKLHENVNIFENSTKYSNGEANVLIHHTGYLREVVKEKKKDERNLRIMQSEVEANPGGFSYYNLGCSYMNMAMYDKAFEMFQKSYKLSQGQSHIKYLIIHTAECLKLMNRSEDGIRVLLDAIGLFPEYIDFYYTLGVLYSENDYLKDAELLFKKCLTMEAKDESITADGVGDYLAHYQLALVYEKKGRIGDSFDEAFKSVTVCKSYSPALELYLKLMQRSGITIEEMQKHLETIYPIKSVKELNNLILALYKVRHPLINKYDFVFNNEKLASIRAVAYLLAGNYMKSLEEWGKVDSISSENLLDVLVLSMIIKDISLLREVRHCLNISDKDWKHIVKIIGMEDVSQKHISADGEKLLLDIAYYLLDIEAFDRFEYISKYLIECSIETQNKLAVRLIARGYQDTALELLSMNIERYPGTYEIPMLIGDICSINGDLTKALDYYNRSLKLKENYLTYEKIYEVYEKLGDDFNMNIITNIIKSRFPLAQWVHSKSS